MNELYRQLIVILHSMWQRRWYALATAWAVTLIGWGLVATIPDKYESSARVYVDTDTLLRPLMRGLAIDIDVMQQISFMQRTLLSRPNMEKVARMTDMDLKVTTDLGMDRLIRKLNDGIRISAQGGNLFRVSYEDEDPALARRVVQALLTIFVEGNLGANRTDLADAQRFIDEQLRTYETQMEELARRRAEFRKTNGGMFSEDGDYFQRLETAKQEMATLEQKVREDTASRDQLQSQLDETPRYLKLTTPTGPLGTGMPGAVSPLVSRIAQIENNITQLKLRGYTDKHPDVVQMQKMLDNAQEELAKEDEANGGENIVEGLRANTTAINPVYDQLQIRLVDADSSLATLQSKLDQQKELVQKLEDSSQSMPALQSELGKINRDYTALKNKYDELLKRRESARLAQDLETKSDNVQFRVIDPPQQPLQPSSPNRPVLLTGVLVLGLGAGVAIAFLFSQLHTTFSTVDRLRTHFSLPVLGTVSRVMSASQRKRRQIRLAMFSAVSASLFVAFAGLMAIELLFKPGSL
jgi:polysaccharide chain length determinant protein (PEP-CTERM system associated)